MNYNFQDEQKEKREQQRLGKREEEGKQRLAVSMRCMNWSEVEYWNLRF